MSATSKLRPRSTPKAEATPFLRAGGNPTRTVQRKALIASSQLVATECPLTPAKQTSRPPSPLVEKPGREEILPAERISDTQACKDDNSAVRGVYAGCIKPRKGGTREETLPSDSKTEACDRRFSGCMNPVPRTTNGTQKRHQSLARSRQKHGNSPKIGRIVPDGLPAVPVLEESKKRCGWITSQSGPAYVAYHDKEWGVPVHDDRKLFEMFILVGAQAEVAWPIILERRELYRSIFAGFDPVAIAKFDEKSLVSLKATSSIVQHERKLRGMIENASQVLKIAEEFGSFDRYLWDFVKNKTIVGKYRLQNQVPVKTPKSERISKDLIKRGFQYVGPTMMYSFMQAVGMVNDHLVTCFRYDKCNQPRQLLECINDRIPEERSIEEGEKQGLAYVHGG